MGLESSAVSSQVLLGRERSRARLVARKRAPGGVQASRSRVVGAGHRGVRYPRIPPPSFLGTCVRLFCLILAAAYCSPFPPFCWLLFLHLNPSALPPSPPSSLAQESTAPSLTQLTFTQITLTRLMLAHLTLRQLTLRRCRRRFCPSTNVDARCAKGRFRRHLG